MFHIEYLWTLIPYKSPTNIFNHPNSSSGKRTTNITVNLPSANHEDSTRQVERFSFFDNINEAEINSNDEVAETSKNLIAFIKLSNPWRLSEIEKCKEFKKFN